MLTHIYTNQLFTQGVILLYIIHIQLVNIHIFVIHLCSYLHIQSYFLHILHQWKKAISSK